MATPREQFFAAQPLPSIGRLQGAPADFVTSRDDAIRIVSVNSQTGVELSIGGRLTDFAGGVTPIVRTHIPNTDRTTKTEDFAIGEGGRLNLSVQASAGAPNSGQTYVIAQLVRGLGTQKVVLGTLFAGYVTAAQPLAIPGAGITPSTAGEPVTRTIVGTAPAAGAEHSETVPTGARWELLSLWINLTASGAVADRRVSLVLTAGVGRVFRLFPNIVQTAGQRWFYTCAPNIPIMAQSATSLASIACPQPTILPAGTQITTITDGIQAGDQWDVARMLVREWLEVN